jgi:hypothetical protein
MIAAEARPAIRLWTTDTLAVLGEAIAIARRHC